MPAPEGPQITKLRQSSAVLFIPEAPNVVENMVVEGEEDAQHNAVDCRSLGTTRANENEPVTAIIVRTVAQIIAVSMGPSKLLKPERSHWFTNNFLI